MTEEARPPGVVLVGPPRSGTTLLRRLLDAHSRLACPPETWLFRAAARFLAQERFADGPPLGVLSGLHFAGFDEAEVFSRVRALVFGFLDDHAEARGRARWVEKTAFNAFHLPAIRRLCGDRVRYVSMVRHGLDTVPSLEELVERTGGYVEELHPFLRQDPSPRRALARAWVHAAEAVADLAEEEDALVVRYEDLVADPEACLGEVLDDLGEPWEEGLVERALSDTGTVGFGDWKTYGRQSVHQDSVGRRARLRPEAHAQLLAICGPTLERLGYAPEPPPAVPDDPLRRYEMALFLRHLNASD